MTGGGSNTEMWKIPHFFSFFLNTSLTRISENGVTAEIEAGDSNNEVVPRINKLFKCIQALGLLFMGSNVENKPSLRFFLIQPALYPNNIRQKIFLFL